MALEIFPSILPSVSQSFSLELKDPVIRSTFETGRARQRLRFENPVRKLTVIWEFDNVEYSIFEYFHRGRLSFGSDWFLLNLPVDDGVEEVECRFISGSFKKTHTSALNWKVSAALEVIDNYGIPEDFYELLTNGSITDFRSLQTISEDISSHLNTIFQTTV